jgi:hypothetical protein
VVFSESPINEEYFIKKQGKITNNILYATHVIIQKRNETKFNIIDLYTFIKETNVFVQTTLLSLFKSNNDDNLWRITPLTYFYNK